MSKTETNPPPMYLHPRVPSRGSRAAGIRRWLAVLATSLVALLAPFLTAVVVLLTTGTVLTVAVPISVALLALAVAGIWGRRARWQGLRRGVAIGSLLALAWWVVAATPEGATPPPPRAGTRYWRLDTGSTIAYERTSSRRLHPDHDPVLVLHGGPGVAERAALRGFVDSLAMPDADFYVYDQVGAGSSSRLDPDRYTLDRDVADLDAIRRHLGAQRVTLIGHSYGSVLAAAYAARHPGRVERMVLISPGPMSWKDHSTNNLFSHLSLRERASLFGRALQPREALTYGLSVLDPKRARSVIADDQADAMSDALTLRASPALYCTPPGHLPSPQTGHYRMQVRPWPLSKERSELLTTQLRGLSTPTIILKGSCDYLSWSSALEYRQLITGSRLCYVLGGGHNLLEERAVATSAMVRDFLHGGAGCTEQRPLTRPKSYLGAKDPSGS